MIQDLIEKIHEAHGSGSDVDQVLSLFNTLERAAGPADAPALVAALERDDADFFTREMFGQILCGFNEPSSLGAFTDRL